VPALREKIQAGISYGETLSRFWKQAQAPRAKDAPTVVSLFAGCGGSSLGYSMAGYHEVLAVEWDDHAAATFKRNFPSVRLYHGDIAKLGSNEALGLSQIKAGELDVLDGSPPCQGFSTAGLRILEDPRNSLFREYVRLIEAFKPRAIVMENVSGMVKGGMKSIFNDIIATLKAQGYNIAVRLLNCNWYGVPQDRLRLIFIGIRNDLKIEPSHPAMHTRKIMLREAFAGINSEGPALSDRQRAVWSQSKQGEQSSDVLVKLGARGSWFNWRRLAWDAPCPTICKTTPSLMHPSAPTFLSIAAAKRASSVPDEFILEGTFGKQWERLGNMVPPLMMRAMALHVRELLSR
jgi:DNA (cytosine-5)-methyltransferase 1